MIHPQPESAAALQNIFREDGPALDSDTAPPTIIRDDGVRLVGTLSELDHGDGGLFHVTAKDGPTTIGISGLTAAQAQLLAPLFFGDVALILHDARKAPPMTLGIIPTPGTYWPEQGGYYDGVIRGDDGLAYHQISASKEFTLRDQAYGKRGQDIPGANSDRDGLTNTIAMAAAGSEVAILVRGLTIQGFKDWHIAAPAQRRLTLVNCAEQLGDDYHWTSKQLDARGAWVQYPYGYQGWDFKDSKYAVLPVRRELVIQ